MSERLADLNPAEQRRVVALAIGQVFVTWAVLIGAYYLAPVSTFEGLHVPFILVAGSVLLLASCGLGTAGGFVPTGELAGPIADTERLDGAEVAVGSKNFSEQLLLGKIAVILLRSAGADVTDLTNIPGSASARQRAASPTSVSQQPSQPQ